MSHSLSRAARRALSRAALPAVGTLVLSLLALGAGPTASGTTTISPAEAGDPAVVRDAGVTIDVDVAALHYYRSTASGTFAATVPSAHVLNSTTCRGDNPAGVNNSPRTIVTVEGPDGTTIASQTSPVRDMSLGGFLTSPPHKPLATQPAPANTNYRGDFPATANTHHGMKLDVDLSGRPAGIYTVVTTTRNTVRTGLLGTCQVGTPGPGGTTVVPGPVVETSTFDYRPWQVQFKDVLGGGVVRANTAPAEVQVRVGADTTPVITGTQTFYSLDAQRFALPNDPEACASDPASCLPAAAEPCVPADGCVPRLMIVNKPLTGPIGQREGLVGVFDLDSKAFIAYAGAGGRERVLMSLGGVGDEIYGNTLRTLSDGMDNIGADLPSILATEVILSNGDTETSLSLLNGLQIDPTNRRGGVTIRTTGTVQAGVVLDIYSHLRLTGPACATNSASSANGDLRYRANEDAGYVVRTSDYLPEVPTAGPLGALVGGPVYSVTGDFVGSTAPLINTASAVIGADTAIDAPSGSPVWVSPFLDSPNVATPKTMDFLGTGTWSASEGPILGTGCLSVNFLLGTGVAVHDNPLHVGLQDALDLATQPNPQMALFLDKVETAVTQVTDMVTTNPLVASTLDQILALLPLSSVPALP